MDIKDMINEVIKKEGGFVNDPLDRGGATNFGITAKTFEHFVGFLPTSQQMASITKEFAAVIYEQEYYIKSKINDLPIGIREHVFDICVNSGQKIAYKILQKAINIELKDNKLVVDGIFGKLSKSSLESLLNSDFYAFYNIQNNIIDLRIQFYKNIVERDSTQSKYLKGWINRAESFRK